jgi:hypothetical protein
MPPETIRDRYDRFEHFRALVQRYDPEGKFRNTFLDSILG